MTTKKFRSVVCHLVAKETGMALNDIDNDFDVASWHDSDATNSEQVDAAVHAADAVLCLNGFRDDDPAMTASLVAAAMNEMTN